MAVLDSNTTLRMEESGKSKNNYPCTLCGKVYVRKSDFAIHFRTHTGERPFTCSVCAKSFAKNSHLTRHVKTHTGEKPYACGLCPKRYARAGASRAHIVRVCVTACAWPPPRATCNACGVAP